MLRWTSGASDDIGDRMNHVERTAGPGGAASTLRPGVPIPAWSFVTDPAARAALAANMATARWTERWSAWARPRIGSGRRSSAGSRAPAERPTRRGWRPRPARTAVAPAT